MVLYKIARSNDNRTEWSDFFITGMITTSPVPNY